MRRILTRMFRCLVAVSVLPVYQAFAGGDETPTGARRVALGNAYTSVSGDLWASFCNPAGLAGLSGPSAGIFAERRYLMSQLNYGAGAFAMPFKTDHVAAIDFGFVGFASYNESRIGLSYATSIVERFRFGARVNYTSTSIANYGNAGTIFVDAGVQSDISKMLSLGFRVFNATRSRIDKELQEDIPTLLSLGVCFKPSEKVMLVSDIEKHLQFQFSYRGGIEYRFMPKFVARAGISTAPLNVSGGLGFRLSRLDLDFASSWHEVLGFTPHLGINFRFYSDKEE